MSSIKLNSIAEFKELRFVIDVASPLSNSVWESNLSTGKALEFVSLIALIREISSMGFEWSIFEFFKNKPEFFYLRNEIPYHHEAQAGHDASVANDISLQDRFKAAILPRATFCANGEKYMVFREGNPLHLIFNLLSGKQLCKERPDLAIVKGEIILRESNDATLHFTHISSDSEKVDVKLSIKNTNLIPIKSFSVSKNYKVFTSGIVECSVSKSRSHVDNQLDTYSSIFTCENQKLSCVFIHGKKDEASYFPTIKIDMNELVASFATREVRACLGKFIKGQLL